MLVVNIKHHQIMLQMFKAGIENSFFVYFYILGRQHIPKQFKALHKIKAL